MITGECDVMCGGSPLFQAHSFADLLFKLMSGRIHRRGVRILYSRSPLSEPDWLFCFLFLFLDSDVGEIHRVVVYMILSFSPL